MNKTFRPILLLGLLVPFVALLRLPAEAVDPKAGPPRVLPPELQSLTLNPASVVGGLSVRGIVTMTGGISPSGVTVSLSSPDRLRGVGFPATVTAGATFTVTTPPVASNTVITITASYGGVTRSATLTILPIGVSSLTCSPATVYGGTAVTCRVNLNGPAPAGAVSNLHNTDPAVATVPATVAITETSPGRPPLVMPYSYGMFTVTTRPVATPTSLRITASYGASNRTASVGVNPPVLSSLTCPSSVTGGNPVTCRATLSGPAPKGGVSVNLGSSNTQVVEVSKAVHITEFQGTRDFTANTSAVATPTSVTITGSYGENRTATVEVKPPAVVALADLFIPGFELTTTGGQPYPDTGFDFVLHVTVSNHPNAPGTSSPSALRVDVTCNQPMTGYPKSWTKSIPGLKPGATAKIPFTVPGLNRGSPNNRPKYSFTMCADSGKVVQETNENNNCAAPYSITQQ